ncbi:redoxin domain-containing protein [Elusimicrobiota bacterium]
MKKLIIVILFIIIAGNVSAEQDARKILEHSIEIYNNMNTYQDVTETVISLSSQGLENKILYTYDAYIKRPNKFYIKNRAGMLGTSVVSNGENLWIVQPALKRYSVSEAPSEFEDFLAADLEKIYSLGTEQFLLALFFKRQENILSDKDISIDMCGEESVEEKIADVISLKKETTEMRFTIERESGYIRKLELNIAKFVEQQTDEYSSGGLVVPTIRYIESHSGIKHNEDIDDKVFKFKQDSGMNLVGSIYEDQGKSDGYVYVGDIFHDFEAKPVNSSKMIRLSDYSEKTILLCFWEAGSEFSGRVINDLKYIHKKYKSKNIEILIINPEKDQKALKKAIDKEKIKFHVIHDKDKYISNVYNINAYPTVITIGSHGIIQQVYSGYHEGLRERLIEDTELLLKSSGISAGEDPSKKIKGLLKQWHVPVKAAGLAIDDNIYIAGPVNDIYYVSNRGSIKDVLKLKKMIRVIKTVDLNNDTVPEFIGYRDMGTEIMAFDRKGKSIWEVETRLGVNSAVLYDLNDDEYPEIAVGLNGPAGLQVLDHKGNIVWKSTQIVNVESLDIGNIAGSEGPELAAISNDGKIYLFNTEGEFIKNIDVKFFAEYLSLIDYKNKHCRLLVSGCSEGNEILKMMNGNNEILWEVVLGNAGSSKVLSIKKHPVNKWIAVSTVDGQVFVFDDIGNNIAYVKDKGVNVLSDWVVTDTGECNLITASIDGGVTCYIISYSK